MTTVMNNRRSIELLNQAMLNSARRNPTGFEAALVDFVSLMDRERGLDPVESVLTVNGVTLYRQDFEQPGVDVRTIYYARLVALRSLGGV